MADDVAKTSIKYVGNFTIVKSSVSAPANAFTVTGIQPYVVYSGISTIGVNAYIPSATFGLSYAISVSPTPRSASLFSISGQTISIQSTSSLDIGYYNITLVVSDNFFNSDSKIVDQSRSI